MNEFDAALMSFPAFVGSFSGGLTGRMGKRPTLMMQRV